MEDNEGDEKDDVKRKSRNLSEKKRRDQFNLLINELAGMVAANNRKMDKSTVLKATIAFFKNQKEAAMKSDSQEIREDWQPSFLSNEEFTHLMLEALDGFIIAVSCSGHILYTSESMTPLLGHLPCDVNGSLLCDLMPAEEQEEMRRFLSNPALVPGPVSCLDDNRERYSIVIHILRGSCATSSSTNYEKIHLTGYFDRYKCPSEDEVLDFSCSEAEDSLPTGGTTSSVPTLFPLTTPPTEAAKVVFVAIGRLEHPQLLREMVILEPTRSEFTSRHSLEWKFLFLDHRAPTIIGYLPFEVLGTSGYEYYHVDDLEKVAECHEVLMKKGKGTSCFYRFLTKGQQWIWLRTQYYITYHQWNSKPEFIVCTNTVVSYCNIKNDNLKGSENMNREELEVVDSESEISEGVATTISKNVAINIEMISEPFKTFETTLSKEDKERCQVDVTKAGPSTVQLPSNQLQTYSFQQYQRNQALQSQKNQIMSPTDEFIDNTSSEHLSKHQEVSSLRRTQFSLQKSEVEELEQDSLQQLKHVVDSSPDSPNSQHSHQSQYTSYSIPLVQQLGSTGEPPPWARRTRSVSSQYNSSSAASDDCSPIRNVAKRPRLKFSHKRQQKHPHSYHYSHSQLQQHKQQQPMHSDDFGPLHSPSSDISENSHESHSSRSSMQQENHLQYSSSRSKDTARFSHQNLDIPAELSQSLLLSHISSSKDLVKEEPTIQYMVQSPSADSSESVITMKSVSSANSSVLPSAGVSGFRHHAHLQQHQQQHHQEQLLQEHQYNSNLLQQQLQVNYSGIDQNYGPSSQMFQKPGAHSTQVVQVATVPLTSVIPMQSVVTNQLIQMPNPRTEGLRQSLFLSFEQQQLQDQLRRKHFELQQHILKQQEELRQVNQQLLMAQYGMNVQVFKAVGVPSVAVPYQLPQHQAQMLFSPTRQQQQQQPSNSSVQQHGQQQQQLPPQEQSQQPHQ